MGKKRKYRVNAGTVYFFDSLAGNKKGIDKEVWVMLNSNAKNFKVGEAVTFTPPLNSDTGELVYIGKIIRIEEFKGKRKWLITKRKQERPLTHLVLKMLTSNLEVIEYLGNKT